MSFAALLKRAVQSLRRFPVPALPPQADAVLARALDAVTQGVLLAGPDRRIVSANAAFSRISGYSADEVLGLSCGFLQGPGTDPATAAAIRAALTTGEAFDGMVLNYRKDGTPFWNELTISPARDERGRLTHFIGILRDATERRQAEAALAASEQRYRELIEHIPAGVVVHGPQSEILLANTRAAELLGITVDEMHGKGAADSEWRFFHENGRGMRPEEFPVSRVLASRAVIQHQMVGIQRPDQSGIQWVICNGYPRFDDAGTLSEAIVSFTDVTGLKQAEQALQKSEERLRLVLEGSRDAPWDWDMATDLVYYSPRWWEMIGYEVDALPVDSSLWRSVTHPDDIARVENVFGKALSSGARSYELEFRMRHKQGHYVPLLARGFILRDAEGRPLRVSGTNTDLTERKLTEERIHQLAYYDPLTGLPNRRRLIDQLQQALQACRRNRLQGALLFIDLDNFKALNDTLGHDKGDQLLRQVAARLYDCSAGSPALFRLGGDEFVVLLDDLGTEPHRAAQAAEALGQKILLALGQPYVLGQREQRSTPSIGVALFDEETRGVDGLLKHADLAMYQAKGAGGNTLRFFDASMQAAIDHRVALENDLRDGLEHNEMRLHYQPQVDESGQVIGAEVLLRWQHPRRGMVSPGEFIPLAEATRLILPLGRWVLRSACERLAGWAHEPGLAPLSLAVNVSAQQFHEPDFVDQVLTILAETGANPTRLKLELTESLLAENIDDIITKMAALKHHGVGFSLDDFGTGYSSLGYLKRLPLDQLKIDQSFVRDVLSDPNDATIARIIITLADKLGLMVIAEGVEDEGQRQFLAANGCLAYQGYLFGRPMPAEQFEGLITPAVLSAGNLPA